MGYVRCLVVIELTLKTLQILYLFFEAYPISFQEGRGWTEGLGALPFLGITTGVFAGCGTTAYITKTRFRRKFMEHGRVVPEERLPPMSTTSHLPSNDQ